MAALDFNWTEDQVKTVYHSPTEIGDLHAFVNKFIRTLDVWDEAHGFVVINPEIHGAPVGSVLLWTHLRFPATTLLSDNAEHRLQASMISHIGRMRAAQTSFQMNYALPP